MSSHAADDVRVQQQERLDVARVARQVVQLLLVEAAADRLALERDVVGSSPETVTVSVTPPTSSVTSTSAVPAARDQHAGLLELLEVGRHDLDPVQCRA